LGSDGSKKRKKIECFSVELSRGLEAWSWMESFYPKNAKFLTWKIINHFVVI
jgi:hypothetical protein